MPFCPECRFEYEDGVSSCPDCKATLVDALPPDPEDLPEEYRDWIHVASLTSYQSAEMLMEVLRTKGIRGVALSGTGFFGTSGQMGPSSFQPAAGAYSIMIPEEDVTRADAEAQVVLGEEWEKGKLVDLE